MDTSKYTKQTQDWLAKIAAHNKVTPEEVISYLRDLSHSKKVIHHLDLMCVSPASSF